MQSNEGLSAISVDRYSAECTSTRHKTGNYNGTPVFIKFIESTSLTLSRDDIQELKMVRKLYTRCCYFIAVCILCN